jgi:hypothetical protein
MHSAMKLPPELSGGVELGLGRGARGTSMVVPARVVVCVVPAAGLAAACSLPDMVMTPELTDPSSAFCFSVIVARMRAEFFFYTKTTLY